MNGLSHLWMVYNLFFYGYYGYYGQWLPWLQWIYTFCPGRCSSQFVRRCGSPLRPRRPSCVCTCTCCDHKKGLRTMRVQPVTGERQQKISNQSIYIYIHIILYYIYILHIPCHIPLISHIPYPITTFESNLSFLGDFPSWESGVVPGPQVVRKAGAELLSCQGCVALWWWNN